MPITVRAKNFDITNALREHVIKKVGKVTRYFNNSDNITAVLSIEKGRHIIEVTIPVDGRILRGEESTADMYASVDLVTEKLEKQISKYKNRITRKIRNNVNKNDLIISSSSKTELDDFHIIKRKRFFIKPMDTEEAMLQMNLIGHDFYVFTNSATDEVNVLYRRKDGYFGLLEPEI